MRLSAQDSTNAELQTFSGLQAGIVLGNEYGFGLGARYGNRDIYMEFGGGLLPIVAFWQVGGSSFSDDTYLKFYLSGVAGAKVSLALNKHYKKRMGLKLGVSYNELIKLGFGGGIDYHASLDPVIVIAGGIMYYPEAYDILFERLQDDEDRRFVKDDLSATLLNIMPFVSVSIYFW
jgi:hypothetical protein